MPTRLKQKDLKEGDNVYMVGIEGITSITIITPTFAGEYNLGPKFSYITTVMATQKTLPITETIIV